MLLYNNEMLGWMDYHMDGGIIIYHALVTRSRCRIVC